MLTDARRATDRPRVESRRHRTAFHRGPRLARRAEVREPGPLDGHLDGTVTRLTNDGYVYSDAAYSPDGKYLSYVRDPGTDMIIQQKLNHGGPSDLYIRPVGGGEPRST